MSERRPLVWQLCQESAGFGFDVELWNRILNRLSTHPHEATWVNKIGAVPVRQTLAYGYNLLHYLLSFYCPTEADIWAIKTIVDIDPSVMITPMTTFKVLPLHTAVLHNCSVGVVEALIKMNPHAVRVKDAQGCTPFMCMMKYPRERSQDHVDIAKLMLDSFPDAVNHQDCDGRDSWTNVLRSSDVYLFRQKGDILFEMIDFILTSCTKSKLKSLPLHWMLEKDLKDKSRENHVRDGLSWSRRYVKKPPSQITSIPYIFKKMLKKYSTDLSVHGKGGNSLCLHKCIQLGVNWNDGLRDVCLMERRAIVTRDMTNGLYPFQLAATVQEQDLNTVYALFLSWIARGVVL